jgi:hypothetical protein
VRKVLIVSSDKMFASLVERQLGESLEVHAAATDAAAFALLDAYTYACVVVDLCSHPLAISVNAVTVPVVALVPVAGNVPLPPNAVACASDENYLQRVAEAVKAAAK